MNQLSIDEIRHDLPAFLQRIEAGEVFVISKAGKPLAEIKPVGFKSPKVRPYGLCKGEFKVPDDFDDPLPENIIQEFEGK
ncbi:type II toxin-antitoxin system Phd/YefM family antitoxin [candidate division KSB1 bacterium]|nr:type II toxin-antitoxin system Phd/YefM family antitoxin [candidate division KSB1 bacterium]MBL7095367.1 type II toxin-antitoxin system Phd/YefM family antitoxin [candidate division KSB1 bacterium]